MWNIGIRLRVQRDIFTDLAGAACCGRNQLAILIAKAERERSEEHTSELQSLMRISYAVFCLKKNTIQAKHTHTHHEHPDTTSQLITNTSSHSLQRTPNYH